MPTWVLLRIYLSFSQWKYFETRGLMFDKISVLSSLEHSVQLNYNHVSMQELRTDSAIASGLLPFLSLVLFLLN